MALGFGAGYIFQDNGEAPQPNLENQENNDQSEQVTESESWPLLDGGEIALASYEGEKPVVLDFWASWCPNCRRSMPVLNGFYDQYKDEVEVIGVNLQEPVSTISQYVSSTGIDFPIVLDPDGKIARSYGVTYTNVHVLINKNGEVVRTIPGDIQESHILELIESSS